MDSTGKLAPGIVGITVCLILVVAVALPVMGSMIGLVDKGELGPGEVTESGANAFDPSLPTFNYLEHPGLLGGYAWTISKTASGFDVRYTQGTQSPATSSADSFTIIIPATTAIDSGRFTADSQGFRMELGSQSYDYPAGTVGDNVGVVYRHDQQGHYSVILSVAYSDSGGTHIFDHYAPDVPFLFVQHCDGMPAATHGYVSGAPSAVIGDGIADSKAFKIDVPAGNSKMAIDMTDAIGLGQRVFLLDNGMVLDLDDRDEPVKASARGDVGGPVLKTSRAAATTAIMVQLSGVDDLGAAADVSSQYAVTWGEYQAPNDLEAPLLESVSKGGSALTGWYVPTEWTHTGEGTVLKQTTIYTVVSILPAILVVALFILVARWAMAEKGDGETRAFLGEGRSRHYDGWRDRR